MEDLTSSDSSLSFTDNSSDEDYPFTRYGPKPKPGLCPDINEPKSRRRIHVDQLTNFERRYNEIVIAIVNQVDQDPVPSVTFSAHWHYPAHGEDRWEENTAKKVFILDKDRIHSVTSSVHTISQLMDKIAGFSTSHALTTSDQYRNTHDQYLRVLSEFHHAISVQATMVLAVMSEIETKTDKLKKARNLKIVDTEGNETSIEANHKKYFPKDNALMIDNKDKLIVKRFYQLHRKLNSYVISTRAEILNNLADVQNLPVEKQELSLHNLYTTLAPVKVDRKRLRIMNEKALSVFPNDDEREEIGSSEARWCHISKTFWYSSYVKNAHIIPAATTHVTIRNVFGDPDPAQILNSSRNFLFLHHKIEKAFDKGLITIIPTNLNPKGSDSPQPLIEFRLLFIDHKAVINDEVFEPFAKPKGSWSNLARSPQLEFRNDHRPGLRNVFWHNISSLARAKQLQFTRYVDALQEFEKAWANIEASSWIAKPILTSMAAHFQMPEINKPDVYLDQAEADKLNHLYTIANLPWEPPLFPKKIYADDDTYVPEVTDEHYTFPFLGPLNFTSPRIVKLVKGIETKASQR